MNTDVLIGLQWGDEGKGKVIDYLADKYDIVARFQGGSNAGHTIEFMHKGSKAKQILHIIPSGIMHKKVMNIIGQGVVFNPVSFVKELSECKNYDSGCYERVLVSDRAALVHPMYIAIDQFKEFLKGRDKLGTTGQGIGPTYGELAYREAMQVGDVLLPWDEFMSKYKKIDEDMKNLISWQEKSRGVSFFESKNKESVTYEDYFKSLELEWIEAVKTIRSMKVVTDTVEYIHESFKEGKKVLAEGGQGTMLDLRNGEYPNVTSSSTVSASACIGLGVPPRSIRKVIGVIKFYSTSVGARTFLAKISNPETEELYRKAGSEFGATTGRPRDCGHLDMVALKYAIKLNGVTEIIVLKNDICLTDKVSVIMSYKNKDQKTFYDFVPFDMKNASVGELRDFNGWKMPKGVNDKNLIPKELTDYINFIQEETGVFVSYIGTGPGREDLIRWS